MWKRSISSSARRRSRAWAPMSIFFSKKYYWEALRNSILLAIVTTILVVCIAFFFAYLGLKGPYVVRGLYGSWPSAAHCSPLHLCPVAHRDRRRKGILTKPSCFLQHLRLARVIIAQAITFLPLGYLMIENVLRSLNPILMMRRAIWGQRTLRFFSRSPFPWQLPGF